MQVALITASDTPMVPTHAGPDLVNGGLFFPSTGAITPLAHMVIITPAAGGVFPFSHWHKYLTCTRATCILWWLLYVVVCVCGGGIYVQRRFAAHGPHPSRH